MQDASGVAFCFQTGSHTEKPDESDCLKSLGQGDGSIMKIFGVILLLLGVGIMAMYAFNIVPNNIPNFESIDANLASLLAGVLAIVGAVFVVGGVLQSGQHQILSAIHNLSSGLPHIETKLDTIKVAAKHSVQDFLPDDKIGEYNGYEIYYKNRMYYIRDVNAKFFSREGAESWIDRLQKKSEARELQQVVAK